MHTKVAAGVVGLALTVAPAVAGAQAVDLNAQIKSLLQMIDSLKAQMAVLQQGGGAGAPGVGLRARVCPALTRALTKGTRGDDVRQLQEFLIGESILATDSATGYFGSLTESALQKWQAQQGVVASGDARTTGWGVAGMKTRAAIARRCALGLGGALPGHAPPATGVSGSVSATASIDDELLKIDALLSGVDGDLAVTDQAIAESDNDTDE